MLLMRNSTQTLYGLSDIWFPVLEIEHPPHTSPGMADVLVGQFVGASFTLFYIIFM